MFPINIGQSIILTIPNATNREEFQYFKMLKTPSTRQLGEEETRGRVGEKEGKKKKVGGTCSCFQRFDLCHGFC